MSLVTKSTLLSSTRLREIHREIAWHYDQIELLKAEANSHSLILALPTEITSKIFASYAFESGTRLDLRWTQVMLVCRRWYDIALGEPELWATIEISPAMTPAFFDAILSRSGVTPLSFRITSFGPEIFASRLLQQEISASQLLQQVGRLREVDHRGAPQSIMDFTNALPRHRFPALRSLRLALDHSHWNTPQVPDAMFDGRAPYLTTLELRYVDANWDLIHGLTGLSLAKQSGTPMDQLLPMLQRSPALAHLNVGHVTSTEGSPAPYPVVSLPLLQSLCIEGWVGPCEELLCHLTVPSSARLSVDAGDGWEIYGGEKLTRLLVPVGQHLRAASAPTIRCLRLDCTSNSNGFKIVTYTAVPRLGTSDADEALFSITTHPRAHSLPQIIAPILGMLSDRGITHLDCRNRTPQFTTLKAWKAALDLLPALEGVYIFPSITAVRVLQALSQLADTRLRHIHITASRVSGDDKFDTRPLVLKELRQLLSLLHARGTPLEILEVSENLGTRLDFDEKSWDLLSRLVGTLVVRNDDVYVVPG
ncbi:hypothetical protein DFH08DRAFT_417822 [Mycena albidolilacea]|uniref:F-box domain-containing protein n=1 Tax=Mycena albidolilacea TaxID=1033008 RepID=A0AAD7EZI8_9AGAR|nr:hypothetical protein DFH08DRAFT_417822 [Mycena albidolilacea]